jgi:hypothetical protein
MKIIAVYNDAGLILAAAVDDKKRGPRPVPSDSTHSGTFEVPESARSLGLEEICTTFHVDAKSKTLAKKRTSDGKKQST